ncbi:MAG: tetratricopeptide repeat-containing protein, partial [Proteobacteria bacterium]|nr:tetratricopeptide repeat-containing protein [Pseudomonadota bacterium]
SGPWVAALAPERRARSSTFHLRLEAKHPGGYAHHSRERYQALAAEGRAALLALRDQQPPPFDGPARWAKERPEGYTDARKIMAAVLLVASHRS